MPSSVLALLLLAAPSRAQVPASLAAQGEAALRAHHFDNSAVHASAAAGIKNPYGVRAFRVLAAHYDKIDAGVLRYAADVDNPFALKAVSVLAEEYGTLFAWQVRWASEVGSARELAAYKRAIARRHSEKDEAEAALIDELRSETVSRGGEDDAPRLEALFGRQLRDAVSSLPPACRARLSGGELDMRWAPEPELPAETALRYQRARPPAGGAEQCSEGRPARLVFYWGPYYVAHGEGDPAALRELVMRRMGCLTSRKNAPKRARLFSFLPKPETDLHDALAPERPRPRSCALRRAQPPRLVITPKRPGAAPVTETRSERLITRDMDQNVAAPSQADAAD